MTLHMFGDILNLQFCYNNSSGILAKVLTSTSTMLSFYKYQNRRFLRSPVSFQARAKLTGNESPFREIVLRMRFM